MFVILEFLRRLLMRLGLVRSASSAERVLENPEHAWRLVGDPAMWSLWMPTVLDRIDPPRPLQAGAHFRFSLRLDVSRMWLGGAAEGHVIVDEFEPGAVLVWRVTAKQGQQAYALRQVGAVSHCASSGGPSAAWVLAELDRQSSS